MPPSKILDMRIAAVFTLLVLAACSGGGGDSGSTAPRAAGSVHLVVDTATGSDALVQFQVVAATLTTDSGNSTANVLGSPKMLTLADPMAQPEGLVLQDVPSGSYATLRLGLAPGSGTALYPSGATVPVSTAFELVVPIDDALLHDSSRASWLVIGHFGAGPASGATGAFGWSPMMRGYGAETEVELEDLRVALVGSEGLTVTDPRRGDAPLSITFDSGCAFRDADGNAYPDRAAFLAAVTRDDAVRCRGRLHRDGRYELDEIRQAPVTGNERSRLIGRITSIDAVNETFVMDVLAEARRGEHHVLPLPSEARVDASSAEIERSNGQYLPFSALAVGNLVKVEWRSRQPNGNGPEDVVAREIDVAPAGGVGMNPQWQGRVDAVDLQQRTITVVPRNNDPIVINGQAFNPVTVTVGQNVQIERRANGGGGRAFISLSEVVPGQDRIWWRGTVTGPGEVDASSVRVKADD